MKLSEIFPNPYTMLVFEVLSEHQERCLAVKLCADERLDRGHMKGVSDKDYSLNYRPVREALEHLVGVGLVSETHDGDGIRYAVTAKYVEYDFSNYHGK
jgi:hypothetical protein